MTAEDIRGVEIRTDAPDSETLRNGVRMLRELAAQLAEFNERERLALQPTYLREISPARPADPTSGTDQARAILSPPAAAQSKPTASPIALRDRWARDRHGVELPEPEGYETVEVNLWKSEQKKPRNKPDAKPFLKVTWQAPNGNGYVDANCFDEKLWPWVISQQGKKARVYVVRNGNYLNLVGVRA